MLKSLTIAAKFACLLFPYAIPASAQQSDVTFFVIGKHANFEQTASGDLEPVDFSFFSEIFFTENGDAENAFLNMPTGERIRYRDQRIAEGAGNDNLLLISGARRFASYAELQSWYPDGVYGVEFDTPSGSVTDGALEFPENGLPAAPRITLRQERKTLCGVADPRRDIEVSWSDFAQGSADENGVLDDLIFVILEDEQGNRVSHSGRPFEEKPYLTFADSSHTIPASALKDERQYTLSVEHAVLNDTRRFDNVPAMTTYAVTTKLKLQTAAGTSPDCSDS